MLYFFSRFMIFLIGFLIGVLFLSVVLLIEMLLFLWL